MKTFKEDVVFIFWIVLGVISMYMFLNWRRKYRLTEHAEEYNGNPFKFIKQAGRTVRYQSTYEGAVTIFQLIGFVLRGGPIAWIIGFLYLLKGFCFVVVAWILSKYNRVASGYIDK